MPKSATVRVALSGGFHNSPEIIIRTDRRNIEAVPQDRGYTRERIIGSLTASQRRKLERHFCGIAGCACGGIDRRHQIKVEWDD